MKTCSISFLCFFVLFISNISSFANGQIEAISDSKEKIRVACIGNSVTFGAGIKNRADDAYPVQLQSMLGDEYDVRNFGLNGATLLKKGHRPYWEQDVFQQAKDFMPHLVIIHLGLNDTDPRNWPNYRDEFNADYADLIRVFSELPVNPKPKVWISRMTPIFHNHPRFKSGTRDWFWQIQNEIERIATSNNTGLIDLHSPLHKRPDLFPDALHPVAEGAKIIAETVYKEITGDYGGLKLPEIFGSNMVLQRNKDIPIYGTANAGTSIEVVFGKEVRHTTVDMHGKWRVSFPAKKAGGPYELKVSDGFTTVQMSDILIGEVWLCSGQSNMSFMLKQSANGDEEIPNANNSQIRFYDMKTIAWADGSQWSESVLDKVNQLEFFNAEWEECTPETASDFSAIAYHFGKMLSGKLGVPVGLIHNSKGGVPAEAWIDRLTIESDPILVDVLYNWGSNDFVQEWARGRAKHNTELSKNPFQRHPFHPAYLFESGIIPIKDFPVKGVIWYQGESNAHNVEFHEVVFPVLVNSWREAWGYEFPFYYVQLSSLNRPTWGHFRDSQRRLMSKITHSGMAVSSDLGDPNDVHPTKKKEVGERLARWALSNDYGLNIEKSGPLFSKVEFLKDKAVVSFEFAKSLKSSDGLEVSNFEIAGGDKVFKPAKATIKKNKIVLYSEFVSKPLFVRYGWEPYFEGNLVNEVGLPASTFSTEFE